MFPILSNVHGGTSGKFDTLYTGNTSINDLFDILHIVYYYITYPLPFFGGNFSVLGICIGTVCLFSIFSTIRKIFIGGD